MTVFQRELCIHCVYFVDKQDSMTTKHALCVYNFQTALCQ